jgi:probable phosphoglycerate mutase
LAGKFDYGGGSGNMSTVFLIRHGESLSNVGLPSLRPETVELTENGWQQAETISQHLYKVTQLDFIVTSSFTRTKQTAQPTLSLFPSVPREVWAVHEFTYLGLQHDILSSIKERRAIVQNYWKQCEPFAVESEDSESFILFIERIKRFLLRLRDTDYNSIAVFTHEQFICAFLWCLQRGWLDLTQDDMKDYREFLDANHIPNGGIVQMQFDDNYRIKQYEVITSHLKTSMNCAGFEHYVANNEIADAIEWS